MTTTRRSRIVATFLVAAVALVVGTTFFKQTALIAWLVGLVALGVAVYAALRQEGPRS